jgi:hypothetical protein
MADFGSMSADQINSSMGFGPGGVGDQSQAMFNNLYGPQGFGGQTAAYAGLGAAYTGATGGNIYGGGNSDPGFDFWSGSRGSPAYDYTSLYSTGNQQQAPAYDYTSLYQQPQPQPQSQSWGDWLSQYQVPAGPQPGEGSMSPAADAIRNYLAPQQQQQPAYDYGSLYGGGASQYTSQPWWSTFAANVGPQAAQDWLNSNGGGGPGTQAPAPMPDPNRLLGYDPNNSANAGGWSNAPAYQPPQPQAFNSYGQPGVGGGGYNPADPFSGMGGQYTSQPWWSTFVANVGQQGAQDWLAAQGGGQAPQPQPQPQPQPSQDPMYWSGNYFGANNGANMGQGAGMAPGMGGFDNSAGLYGVLGRVGMSMSDWATFTNAVGPQAAQQWLNSQGGGGASAPAQPQQQSNFDPSRLSDSVRNSMAQAIVNTDQGEPNAWEVSRAPYASQLSNDPARSYDMAVRLYLEDQNNSDTRQAIAEAMFNRNAARGLDPLDPSYFPQTQDYLSKYANARNTLGSNEQLLSQIYGEMGNAIGGSNLSQGATDWASGDVAANAAKNATSTWTSPSNEQFFRRDLPGTDTGDAAAKQIQDWYQQMQNWQPQ